MRLRIRGGVGGNESRRRQARRMWSAKAVLAMVAVVAWRPLTFAQPTEAAAAFVPVVPTTGTATGGGCHVFSGRQRRCHPHRPWMSANDITPANGLTTTSGTVQRGGTGGSRPEPDLFEDFLASVRVRTIVGGGVLWCSCCFLVLGLGSWSWFLFLSLVLVLVVAATVYLLCARLSLSCTNGRCYSCFFIGSGHYY